MPGRLPANPRKGNQAEYLAQYLLSCIGLVIPVPRQEDEGQDFYCTVATQKGINLTFDSPYMIQVKKSSIPSISYGGVNKDNIWNKHEIEWLFKQNLPILIGIIETEKGKNRLHFFSASTFWFVYYHHPTASKITLSYNLSHPGGNVGSPTATVIDNYPADCGDGMEYTCDMGPAIATISVDEALDDDSLNKVRAQIRSIVELEQSNIVYRRMRIPYFKWLWNYPEGRAGIMYANIDAGSYISPDYCNVLFTSAILFYQQGHAEKYQKVKALIRCFPREVFPEINDANSADLRAVLTDLFGNN